MFSELPVEYYYPALAFFLVLLVALFVPKEESKKLFWISFLWGYLGSKIFVIVFGGLMRLFKWKQAMPFEFLGAPHWLVLGWGFCRSQTQNPIDKFSNLGGHCRQRYSHHQ